MAISLIGTPQASAPINGGNATLTFSVAPQEGDVVYVWGGHFARAGSGVGPSTAGYTELFLNTATNCWFGVWRKVMGASPDSNVVCQGSGNTADAAGYACFVLRGVDRTPEDVALTSATGSSTNPNPPSITPVRADAWILALAASAVTDASPGTPTNYTNLIAANGNDSNDYTVAGCLRALTTPAAEDPPAYPTWSTGAWVAATIAVRPDMAAAGDGAAGVGAAPGVGAAVVAGDSAAAGVATADAEGSTGSNVQSGAGTAAGVATTTAVGDALKVAAATSDGGATAPGVGSSTAEAVGFSFGIATTPAAGTAVLDGVGSAPGGAAAVAEGASTAAADGTAAAGAATAPAQGSALLEAVGTASAGTTASAVGDSPQAGDGVGSAVGVATVLAVGAVIVAAAGTAAGTATVLAVGADGDYDEPEFHNSLVYVQCGPVTVGAPLPDRTQTARST